MRSDDHHIVTPVDDADGKICVLSFVFGQVLEVPVGVSHGAYETVVLSPSSLFCWLKTLGLQRQSPLYHSPWWIWCSSARKVLG